MSTPTAESQPQPQCPACCAGETDTHYHCPDCRCVALPHEAFCWRCGAGIGDEDDPLADFDGSGAVGSEQ